MLWAEWYHTNSKVGKRLNNYLLSKTEGRNKLETVQLRGSVKHFFLISKNSDGPFVGNNSLGALLQEFKNMRKVKLGRDKK